MAKLEKDENVSMEVLCKICKALDCGLDDIIEIIPDDEE
ncbi:MAG: helix-turn-helix domain-containing protein [Thomasclavelia spiroformis]